MPTKVKTLRQRQAKKLAAKRPIKSKILDYLRAHRGTAYSFDELMRNLGYAQSPLIEHAKSPGWMLIAALADGASQALNEEKIAAKRERFKKALRELEAAGSVERFDSGEYAAI